MKSRIQRFAENPLAWLAFAAIAFAYAIAEPFVSDFPSWLGTVLMATAFIWFMLASGTGWLPRGVHR